MRHKTTLWAVLFACGLLFTGCLFGGGEQEDHTAAQDTAAQQDTGDGTQAAGPTKEQESAADTKEAPQAGLPHTGPVAAADVADDLKEAVAALTGDASADAHLLGADGLPMTDFAYEGGAALIAPYVRIETGAVTGQDETATVELTVTSPNLLPLIEQAVAGMQALDEAQMNENLAALLAAGGYAETAYAVKAELRYVEGGWYIVQNEELANALTGGLLAAEREAAPKAGGGQ